MHMLEIALLSVSMCEREGEGASVTGRRVGKTKREAVRVCFSAASHKINRNTSLFLSHFFFH